MSQDENEIPEIVKHGMVVGDCNPFLLEVRDEMGDYQVALNRYLESIKSQQKTWFEDDLISLKSQCESLVNGIVFYGYNYYKKQSQFLISVYAASCLGEIEEEIKLNHRFSVSRLPKDDVTHADSGLVNLLCNSIRFSIKMTGNALHQLFPKNIKTFLDWRLAFLDFVNRLEFYAENERDAEWSDNFEREDCLKEISGLIQRVCYCSGFVRDILLKVERTEERIGRFLIYRDSKKEISEIILDSPKKIYTIEARATPILEKLFEDYRRESVFVEDINIRLSDSHCIIYCSEREFDVKKETTFFPDTKQGVPVTSVAQSIPRCYMEGWGIRQTILVMEKWLNRFFGKNTEPLHQWREACLAAVDLFDEYAQKLKNHETIDINDFLKQCEERMHKMFDGQREIMWYLRGHYPARIRAGDLDGIESIRSDNLRKGSCSIPSIGRFTTYSFGRQFCTRVQTKTTLHQSLYATTDSFFSIIRRCLFHKAEHAIITLKKRIGQETTDGWVPSEKGWRQAFPPRKGDENKKSYARKMQWSSADDFFKDHIEQRTQKQAVRADWRIKPDVPQGKRRNP